MACVSTAHTRRDWGSTLAGPVTVAFQPRQPRPSGFGRVLKNESGWFEPVRPPAGAGPGEPPAAPSQPPATGSGCQWSVILTGRDGRRCVTRGGTQRDQQASFQLACALKLMNGESNSNLKLRVKQLYEGIEFGPSASTVTQIRVCSCAAAALRLPVTRATKDRDPRATSDRPPAGRRGPSDSDNRPTRHW
jgi:hypothetical protein